MRIHAERNVTGRDGGAAAGATVACVGRRSQPRLTCAIAQGAALAAVFFVHVAASAEPPLQLTHEQIEARYADEASRFVEVDSVRLHYKDEGMGPAILLIHGSAGDVSDWDGWVRVLAENYRVVRFDLPGFGLSGRIANGNYSIDRSQSLIDGLMDILGIERFAIAGVSYGGPVAFRYAATRTERVTALVIMNSAGVEYGKQTIDPKTGEKEFYQAVTGGGVTREFMIQSLHKGFNNPALVTEALIQRKLDMMNVEGRTEEGAIMIRQYERGDPFRVLAHVRAPVLVLWGGAERSLSQETGDKFAVAVTRARAVRKVVQPGGDHMMHVEMPEPTARVVERFLNEFVSGEYAD
jgi:pimeloyl-ACP methyl ester carboxylesterase